MPGCSQQTTARAVTDRPMVDDEQPKLDLRKVKNPFSTAERPQEGSLESGTFYEEQPECKVIPIKEQEATKKTMKKKLLCQDDEILE